MKKIKKTRVSFLVGAYTWERFKGLCEEGERTPSEQLRILIHDMIIRDELRKKANQTAKP